MTTVHVFGDSWSWRSFQKLPDFKEKPGNVSFQQLFDQQGVVCRNYSKPASSNQEIVNTIKACKLKSGSVAVVFQTDPLRDMLDRTTFTVKNGIPKGQSLAASAEQSLNEFYQNLGDLDVPVLLVGGLSSLCHARVPKHIHTVKSSWTELVEPGFKDCYFEWKEFAELAHIALQCKDDLTSVTQQIQSKNAVWQKSPDFAWCHPSDGGYRIMFDTILQSLNNKGML